MNGGAAMRRALACASSYVELLEHGRTAEAGMVRLTIEELVGHPVGNGRVELPRPVAIAMGRYDLAKRGGK